MNIKVNKGRLVTALEAKKTELVAELAQQTTTTEEFKEYREKAVACLTGILADVKKAKALDAIAAHYYMPEKPFKKARRQIYNIEQDLNTIKSSLMKLSLTDEETITVNDRSDDYAFRLVVKG